MSCSRTRSWYFFDVVAILPAEEVVDVVFLAVEGGFLGVVVVFCEGDVDFLLVEGVFGDFEGGVDAVLATGLVVVLLIDVETLDVFFVCLVAVLARVLLDVDFLLVAEMGEGRTGIGDGEMTEMIAGGAVIGAIYIYHGVDTVIVGHNPVNVQPG